MEQILDVLYNYIQENRIAYYLNGDPEYCLAGRRMDEAEVPKHCSTLRMA